MKSTFIANKNVFGSTIKSIEEDFHSYCLMGAAKGKQGAKRSKKTLIKNVTQAIESIETADFAIRVCVFKCYEPKLARAKSSQASAQ